MNLKRLLSTAAVCASFLFARSSVADTLKLVGVGGESAGGVYVYPYNFSVNGSNTTTSLMCMNYDREITFGEQWAVSVSGISTSTDPLQAGYTKAMQYRAEAYLFSLLGGTTDAADIQFAAWEIFDSAVTGAPGWKSSDMNLVGQAIAAANDQSLISSGFFSRFQIYTPLSGAPYDQTWTAGKPQEFIGLAPTPEPSSMLLLGTGLFASGLLLRRRKPTAHTRTA